MVTGVDGSVWVFGGADTGSISSTLFKLDVLSKQWITVTTSGASPSARAFHTMTTVGSVLYMFGGLTGLNGES
jgi:hypothetical protein